MEKVVNISLEKMVKNSRTKQNFSVEENDKIIIGSKSNIVSVQGGGLYAGNFSNMLLEVIFKII